jgi:hypothetical protein
MAQVGLQIIANTFWVVCDLYCQNVVEDGPAQTIECIAHDSFDFADSTVVFIRIVPIADLQSATVDWYVAHETDSEAIMPQIPVCYDWWC